MTIENIIKEKISNLEDEINKRESEEWQNLDRDGDTNGYSWNHCGEREFYQGKLTILKDLINEIEKCIK